MLSFLLSFLPPRLPSMLSSLPLLIFYQSSATIHRSSSLPPLSNETMGRSLLFAVLPNTHMHTHMSTHAHAHAHMVCSICARDFLTSLGGIVGALHVFQGLHHQNAIAANDHSADPVLLLRAHDLHGVLQNKVHELVEACVRVCNRGCVGVGVGVRIYKCAGVSVDL